MHIWVCFLIGSQMFINPAVCSNLAPTKGILLPCISYGGASIIASCVAIMGIVLGTMKGSNMYTKKRN